MKIDPHTLIQNDLNTISPQELHEIHSFPHSNDACPKTSSSRKWVRNLSIFSLMVNITEGHQIMLNVYKYMTITGS